MKRHKISIIILSALMLIILISNFTSAKNYHMTLLTVGEAGENLIGGTADAYLEIKPGQGRIFLDSFPLTKLDTQISTRYANQIACDYLDMDCSNFDFFYTIRASSSVVGGPSASAPLTILTIAALKGIDLRNDTVMTGTINSGGSIGPVGGVKEKTLAAQRAGFKKVLIPKFSIDDIDTNSSQNESIEEDKENSTINRNVTIKISDIITKKKNETEKITVEVVEVANLEEALVQLTDKIPPKQYPPIIVPEEYKEIMKDISTELCQKANDLKNKTKLTNADFNKTIEFENKSKLSLEQGNYYSAASFCFNKGVMLRRLNLQQTENNSTQKLNEIRRNALEAVLDFDKNLEKINITTLPNLESYIIVKERLLESEKELTELKSNVTTDRLAYAIERYYSGVSWSKFFEMNGKQISLDQEHLEEACNKKISEAEERTNYVELYLPELTKSATETLAEAYLNRNIENYEMCLFKASFAKSESNMLLSSMAIDGSKIKDLSAEKILSAQKLIGKETSQGFFPIMGYSYYEYAKSLHENGDYVSALIFSEYALELSNLQMYFPKQKRFSSTINIRPELWAALICTLILGMTLGSAVTIAIVKKNNSVFNLKKTTRRSKK